jgi:hypothetical protein
VTYRGLFFTAFAVAIALVATLTAAWAAEAAATLTVPAQVQTTSSATVKVQPSFSFPEATPFCTVGVDYTWDGVAWLSEFPTKDGALCVAGGVTAPALDGHTAAGQHQVCASAGPRFKDCKTLTIVVSAAGAPATAQPGGAGASANQPAAPAASAPAAQPGPLLIPSDAPAPRAVAAAVNSLPAEQRVAGLALLSVGVLGLLAILGRRLLLSRRRKPTPLPAPSRMGGPGPRR